MHRINILAIGSALISALFAGEAAATENPYVAFNPQLPFEYNDVRTLDMQSIRRFFDNSTRWETANQDRYSFHIGGNLVVQPFAPLPGARWGDSYYGHWEAKDGRGICMSLKGMEFGPIGPDERCFQVLRWNYMMLLSPEGNPGQLALLFNSGVRFRFILTDDQQEIYVRKVFPEIVKAEEQGDKEAPAESFNKWNPPKSEMAKALHSYLSSGGRLTYVWTMFRHWPNGDLLATRENDSVRGRWWMDGDLYCMRVGARGLPPKTTCLSPEVMIDRPSPAGLEGIHVKPGKIALFGRSFLEGVRPDFKEAAAAK